MHVLLSSSLLLLAVFQAAGYSSYKKLIPNSGNIDGVKAIGHTNPNGGGERNQFGLDFVVADRKWTTAFCQADSDGDGVSNGRELGDPCCDWASNSKNFLYTSGISNPGDNTSIPTNTELLNKVCSSTVNETPDTTGATPAPAADTPIIGNHASAFLLAESFTLMLFCYALLM